LGEVFPPSSWGTAPTQRRGVLISIFQFLKNFLFSRS
jgi:hypothetical protein